MNNALISSISNGYAVHFTSGASKRMPNLAQMFQDADTKGTGSIDKSQLKASLQSMNLPSTVKAMGADELFKKLDADKNGSVSRSDFLNGMREVIAQDRQKNPTATPSSATQAPPPPNAMPPMVQDAAGKPAPFSAQPYTMQSIRSGAANPGATPAPASTPTPGALVNAYA